MDFSVLADRRAPWHGHSAYVGTPGYFSPEHLSGGLTVPQPASDIFTCGLILYELLAQGHPYRFDNDADYLRAAQAHKAPKPELLGQIEGKAESSRHFVEVLHRCLLPRASERPTAKEVHLALNGQLAATTPTTEPCVPPVKKDTLPTSSPRKNAILITNAKGVKLEIGVTTPFGKALLRTFGEDAKYADDLQFTIERRDGHWWIVPPPHATKNHTMFNKTEISSPKQLSNGDQIAIGSRSDIARSVLPLTLSFA